ncbi:MAG: hypothetical protein RIG77_01995 [Cyclobacteriaceae bacterium]
MRVPFLYAIILAVAIFIFSCGDLNVKNQTQTDYQSIFINMDSLINEQIARLEGRKLRKEVTLEGEREELLLISDSVSLANDLNFFAELDISKPTFRGEYDIRENGPVKSYQRTGKLGPQIIELKRSPSNSLLALEGEYTESNMLFSSSRKYLMQFDQESSELRRYEFSGYQKLLFRDTVFFSVMAEFQ